MAEVQGQVNTKQGGFVLERAEEKDIKGMANIENEFFGSYSRAIDEKVMMKWYEHNPDMFYVVKDNDDRVLAFSILTPVSEKLYGSLKRGEISDLFDFPEAEVPKTFQSDYFYVADICVSKAENKINYLRVFTALLSGIIKVIYENAKYVTTSPITKEGSQVCKHLGFVEVSRETYEGKEYPICELTVSKEKYDKLSSMFNLGRSR